MTVQALPDESVVGDTGQLLVWAKSPASAPVIFKLLKVIGVPLGLPTVTIRGEVVFPTFSFPKLILLGNKDTMGKFSKTERVLE